MYLHFPVIPGTNTHDVLLPEESNKMHNFLEYINIHINPTFNNK